VSSILRQLDATDDILPFMPLPTGLTALGTRFGVGLGLFYGAVKFFDLVGDRLNEDTRLEIAVWLLGVKTAERVQNWPETFTKVFDRLFGTRHLSWKCFWRSCVITYLALLIGGLVYSPELLSFYIPPFVGLVTTILQLLFLLIVAGLILLCTNALPDYVSLLKSRYLLRFMASQRSFIVMSLLVLFDVLLTLTIGAAGIDLGLRFTNFISGGRPTEALTIRWLIGMYTHPFSLSRMAQEGRPEYPMLIFPAFFTIIWTLLYASSGFLLKTARRFDVGFEWFNRHMDIEKKPLQSIGIVAGVIVAVVYWGVVIIGSLTGESN
jgi:hypothetical protein